MSSLISAVTLTTSNIVDGQQIDATDVTVPFSEVQNNLPANAGYLLSVSATDTYKKYLYEALAVVGDIAIEIINDGADEKVQITVTTGGMFADGRLTRSSGVPVVNNGGNSSTLYYTPYRGNKLTIYDGSAWQTKTFTELSISNVGLSANTNYDVFVYLNSGTPTLVLVAWSGATTRATALTRLNGVLVLNGTPTRRYLGTVRVDEGGDFYDGPNQSFIWNYYNRILRMFQTDQDDYLDTWSYNSTTWREVTGTSVRFNFVVGVTEDVFKAEHKQTAEASADIKCGVGYDGNSNTSGGSLYGWDGEAKCAASTHATIHAKLELYGTGFVAGFHYVVAVEANASAGTYNRRNSHLSAQLWC